MRNKATIPLPATPAVLVIDDEPNNLDVVARALHGEFQVHLASSAGEALRLLSSGVPISVIIADQRMPEMTGVEFLQRAIDLQPLAKRLLVTAYADIDVVVGAVNLGRIHHYIQKPFEPAALRATTRQLSELSRLEAANESLVGDLRHAVESLREKEAMLARSLDERGRELMRAVEELKAKNETLEQLALRDGLTGLYNHRSFQQRLREEVARAQRQSSPLSLVMADVDHFKRINDERGHPVGDSVLKRIAALLTGVGPDAPPTRKTDLVARYGGEEFAIILLDTPKEGAAVRAERLREAVIAGAGSTPDDPITMSFGVACYPDDALDAEGLIQRADDALLRAKAAGRNQVVLWAHKPTSRGGRSQVRPLADVRATLAAALRKERSLSVVSLLLTDLGRLERHYGVTGASRASEAFEAIAIGECDDLVPASCLLAVVSDDPNRIQVFLRLPADVAQLGPRYLEQTSDRLSARVEAKMQETLEKQGLGLARVVSGHATQLFTPTAPTERQLDRVRADAHAQADVSADLRRGRDKLDIQRLILEGSIRSMLQPVFGDAGARVIGYEALARGPMRSALESPVVMLDLAEDVELITELDLSMSRAGFAAARHLDGDQLFFLNVLPSTLSNAAFYREELPRMVEEAGIPPSRVVLELSERQSADSLQFARALEILRAAGFVLGLDDLGTQNANLAEIAAYRPEWIKLDRSLVRTVDRDPVRRDLIGSVVDFSRKQGSRVVAEGIETTSELELLRALGVEFFQGYLLGAPQEAETLSAPRVRAAASREIASAPAAKVVSVLPRNRRNRKRGT